ncbi:hypothetical protein ACLSZW_05370 [Avibacterium avium]|uniref:hypothetical protein n=1 Tax=Avibacterium avium TaxID=751 RepID=UPI003BF8F12D
MQQQDFELYRGDDTLFKLSFAQGEQPYLIEGGELTMDIVPMGGKIVRMSAQDNSIIVLDESHILLNFYHDLTKDWTWKKADYDLQLTKDGKVKTLMRGKMHLTHDITR